MFLLLGLWMGIAWRKKMASLHPSMRTLFMHILFQSIRQASHRCPIPQNLRCMRETTDQPTVLSSFRRSCTIWFRLACSWTIWFRLAPIEDMDSTKRESHHGAIVVSVASSSPSSQHIARNFESGRPCPSTIFWTMGSSPSIGHAWLQKTRTR
jgi:hypothetical protein